MITRDFEEKDKQALKDIFSLYWTDPEFLQELSDELDLYLKQKNNNSGFYVAEKDGEVVGIAGFRKAPEYLRTHAETKNPAELYIIASKLQNKGIGSMLVQKVTKETVEMSFTEIECYSPETHSDSWKFYENLGFTRHGIIKDPDDGYPGILWRKILF